MTLMSFAPVMQPLLSSSQAPTAPTRSPTTGQPASQANGLGHDDNVTSFVSHSNANLRLRSDCKLLEKFRFTVPLPTQTNQGSDIAPGTANLLGQLLAVTQQLANQVNNQTSQVGVQGNNGQNGNAGSAPQNTGSATNNLRDLSTIVSLNESAENLQKWQQAAPSGNYSYTLIQRNGANGATTGGVPIHVTVSNGRISSAAYANSTPVDAQTLAGLPTIEGMFSTINSARSHGERTDAIYNVQKGFPEFVFLGNDRNTGADDVSYIFRDVKVI